MDYPQDIIKGQWEAICARIQSEQRDRFAVRWLSKIVPDKIENNQIHLLVPSPCIHELVKQNYADQILSLWQEQNADIGSVNLQLTTQKTVAKPIVTPIQKPIISTPSATVDDSDTETIPSLLDPTNTFDSFVVGPSNQFACSAARQVAEDESAVFSPLYIQGGVGLGKTHLLHAIAWRLRELHPDKNVLYLSSEQFFHKFIQAMRLDKTNRFESTAHFRDLFRSVDILLIDDIQFICGKKATQEEFFHTFNALTAQGKKIVLSSNRLPQDLQGIDERLRTRIAQGLVVSIRPTSYELRLGIVKKKASTLSTFVPEAVLDFLARNVTANIRELEGALKRIVAHAELVGGPINLETTRVVLKDILNIAERTVTIADIQNTVCAHYQLSLVDLKSNRRERRIARPRQLAMYLSKILTPCSMPDIGAQFGRDHTTIMHAVKTIEGLLMIDNQVFEDVTVLTRRLKEGESA